MNIVNTYQKYNAVKAIFNATDEEYILAQTLKNRSLLQEGPILYITATKQSAINLYNETITNLKVVEPDFYYNRKNLIFMFRGDTFIIKDINEINRHLDGIRYKEVYFVD